MSSIGPITNSVIETISNELKKKDVKDKILKKIWNPLFNNVAPYVILLYVLIFLILVINTAMLILIIFKK